MIDDLAHRVARGSDRLLLELAAGTAVSLVAGVLAAGSPRPAARAFGRQTLGWAGIDAAVVLVGVVRRSVPSGDEQARTQARQLRRTTAVNAVLDVGYLAGSAVLARVRPQDRPAAAAAGVQGLFLLWLDARHARAFHALTR